MSSRRHTIAISPQHRSDKNCRYQMPSVILKCESQGNGKKTKFVNWLEVCSALHREPLLLSKHLGTTLKTRVTVREPLMECEIAGHVEVDVVQKALDAFIKSYVLCKTCSNPETQLLRDRSIVYLQCDACGYKKALAQDKITSLVCIKEASENSYVLEDLMDEFVLKVGECDEFAEEPEDAEFSTKDSINANFKDLSAKTLAMIQLPSSHLKKPKASLVSLIDLAQGHIETLSPELTLFEKVSAFITFLNTSAKISKPPTLRKRIRIFWAVFIQPSSAELTVERRVLELPLVVFDLVSGATSETERHEAQACLLECISESFASNQALFGNLHSTLNYLHESGMVTRFIFTEWKARLEADDAVPPIMLENTRLFFLGLEGKI